MALEPSLARSRVWAPLGLLLVLACGAWYVLGSGWLVEPAPKEAVAPAASLIRPLPASPGGGGAGPAPIAPGEGTAGLTAGQVMQEVAQRGRQAPAAASGSSQTMTTDSLQAQIRRDPAAVHRQTAGQRLRLQGSLASVESGEPGVVVLHLALADEPGTVRVVASPYLAQAAADWVHPRAVSLDCLSQGVMMGEWLLVDCRE